MIAVVSLAFVEAATVVLEAVTGCVESSAKAGAILDAKPLAIVAPASVVIKICLALNIIVFNPFCLLQTFLSPFTNSNEVLFKKLYLFFHFFTPFLYTLSLRFYGSTKNV